MNWMARKLASCKHTVAMGSPKISDSDNTKVYITHGLVWYVPNYLHFLLLDPGLYRANRQ